VNKGKFGSKTKHQAVIIAIFCMIIISSLAISVQSDGITGISGSNSGTICGIVTDGESNEPIPDAKITLSYHEEVDITYTDSNGKYKFKDVPLCFCMKEMIASKDGYESQLKEVAVNKITCVNFELKPVKGNGGGDMGTLLGFVTDSETEEPIQDTLIILKYHDVVRKHYTDSDGYYIFDSVPICFCLKDVSAYKEGYEEESRQVAVSEITYANFSLDPSSKEESQQGTIKPSEITNGMGYSTGKENIHWVFPLMIILTIVIVIDIMIITKYKRTLTALNKLWDTKRT
jgi:hypothetical protein